MARVHSQIARESKHQRLCRRCGSEVVPGETYFYLTNRIGRRSIKKIFCKNHPPRPSDKTTSDKLGSLYRAQEDFADSIAKLDNLEDIAQAVRDVAQTAEDVGQEYSDSKDNMPEQLQDSSGLDEKIEACESWKDALEQAADEVEGMDLPEGDEKESALESARQTGQDAVDQLEL